MMPPYAGRSSRLATFIASSPSAVASMVAFEPEVAQKPIIQLPKILHLPYLRMSRGGRIEQELACHATQETP
jgi:hypothetical protein